MDTPPAIDTRLTELEIKLSFTEDALDQLNAVVVRQQAQIDALTTALIALRQQAPAEGPARSLFDELPPHY
jgi:SlyX protein